MVGVNHCVAICNATVGLEIAIRALGMRGEVIVPSFTFVATAHALQWQEIVPVFCDINPATHNLDPDQIERLITPNTTGIIGVHLWGRPCDIDALERIAARNNLKLLFDSAHAFGCSYKGSMVGGFGHAEVFSFHATKFLNSLEGGAVVTNDSQLAQRMRLMKNFGFTTYDKADHLGINGKMNEVSAAMGLTNLESLDDFITLNRAHYEKYREELSALNGITLLPYDEAEKGNYQYVVIEIDSEKAGVTRDQVMEILHAENVLARRYFYPGCHRMEPYKTMYPHAHLILPNTEHLVTKVLTLPTGQAVDSQTIAAVSAVIRTIFENGTEIAGRLTRRSAALTFGN